MKKWNRKSDLKKANNKTAATTLLLTAVIGIFLLVFCGGIYILFKPYTITMDLNDGTETVLVETYNLNSGDINIGIPVREGYRFTGWTGSNGNTPQKEVKVEKGTTSSLTFKANFKIDNYTITYEGIDTTTNPDTYTVNDTITLTRPTKAGYTFIGWTSADITNPTLDVTIPVNSVGDRTYEAHFTLDSYRINYELNGGTVTGNPETYTINDSFILNNPEKEGYTFIGWIGSNGTTPSDNVRIDHETGVKNYEAKFEANTYTIVFDKNDSTVTGTMDNMNVTYDEEVNLTKNTFTKDKYQFVEWTTEPDGTGTVYEDEALVKNLVFTGSITLYAKWNRVYTATFQSGGNVNAKMKQLSGQSGARYSTSNSIILKVKYSDIVPSEYQTENNRVSETTSEKPIYMWFDSDTKTIYYGSEADEIYLGKDASYFFNAMPAVTEIENHFKTDNCLNMTQMYWGDHELAMNDVSKFNTSNVNSMASMFGENWVMPSYDVKNWDVKNVKTFSYLFNENKKITSLDLSTWDTSSATNMRNMFSNTRSLTSLDVSSFDTSKVTDMQAMFNDSVLIETLDLSNFDTRNVTNFSRMFKNTQSLENLNISSFKMSTTKSINMDTMFNNSISMKTLDLSSFNTAKVTNFNNMFSGMTNIETIYVSDDFVTTGITTNPVMFNEDRKIVGGAGTTYTLENNKADRAHIDGGESNPGYFTRKTN